MSAIFALPRDRIVDSNGRPVSGAKIYFYNTGTVVAKTVYQDSTLVTPHPQPVVCDSGGLVPLIFLSGTYKVLITTSSGTTIYEADNLDAALTTSGGVLPIALGGTGAPNAAGALAALGAATQAALDALSSSVASILSTIGAYPVFGALAAKNEVSPTDLVTADWAPVCVQRSVVTLATRSALSGSIPIDNTTPLRSEGDTIFSTTFTPKSATNTIRIKARVYVAGSGGARNMVIALFAPGIGASDPAIAAAGVNASTNQGIPEPLELEHEFTAGQTTAMTIQINTGGSGSYIVNGIAAGVFNGLMLSRLVIEEWHQP